MSAICTRYGYLTTPPIVNAGTITVPAASMDPCKVGANLGEVTLCNSAHKTRRVTTFRASFSTGAYQEKVHLSPARHPRLAWQCQGTLTPHISHESFSVTRLKRPRSVVLETDIYASCLRHSRGIRSQPIFFHFPISPLRRQP